MTVAVIVLTLGVVWFAVWFTSTNAKPKDPIPRGLYQHFKGGVYRVIGFAMHSETLETYVEYMSLYDSEKYPKGTKWTRPLSMFTETVVVDGVTRNRFNYMGD